MFSLGSFVAFRGGAGQWPLSPAHSSNPKKVGSPVLETIFQRKYLPDRRYCLTWWLPSPAEIMDMKVLLQSRKQSIVSWYSYYCIKD